MKKKMKSLAMLLAMVLMFGACAGPDGGNVTPAPQITDAIENVGQETEVTPTEAVEPTATLAPTATPKPTATPWPTATPEPTEPWVGGSEAAKLISNLTIGWNLGNALDSESSSETAWGNPKTTQEMIDMVAEAGFNTVRIPTTWYYHMDRSTFEVKEDWLARVKEVVDYCYANDMYVILNTHHETGWMALDPAKLEATEQKFVTLWQQIAEYFKDYDDHLIFEGMNEPRVKGHAQEWNGGTKEHRESVAHLNQVFVDTVRATGGNNETRVLLITSYCASSSRVAMSAVKVPNDPYVGVSIHAYTPYNFAFKNANDKYDVKIWDGKKNGDIDAVFRDINTVFLSKGVPVIITEFGAVNKTDLPGGEENLMARCQWVEYYVTKAKEFGVPCVQWDNNVYKGTGERFGLLDRRNLEWYEPEYIETMVNAAMK